MRLKNYPVLCVALLFNISAQAQTQVPHSFQAGDPARAADVNENFAVLQSAINQNAQTIGTQGDRPQTSFGPEWYLQPSASGELASRNVIVYKGYRPATNGCASTPSGESFVVRTYFTNTAGRQLNNASGLPVTPDEIWIYGEVGTSSSTVNSHIEWVYGLPVDSASTNPRGAWESAVGVEINIDGDIDGVFEASSAYDYTLTYASSPLSSSQMTHEVELFRDGNEILSANDWSTVSSLLPDPVRIGDPLNVTFTEAMVASLNGPGSGGRLQFHAKGIGMVEEIWNDFYDDPEVNCEARYSAIYIRVDGIEYGTLTGTPFAPGGASAGLWFE